MSHVFTPLYTLRCAADSSSTTSVAFALADSLLISGDSGGRIHVWSLATRRIVRSYPPLDSADAVNQIRILNDTTNATTFAVFYKSGALAVYDAFGVIASLLTRSVSFARPHVLVTDDGAAVCALPADSASDILIVQLAPRIQYVQTVSVVIPLTAPTPFLLTPRTTYSQQRDGTLLAIPNTSENVSASAVPSESVGAVMATRLLCVSALRLTALVACTESGHITVVTFASAAAPPYYRGHSKMSALPLLSVDVSAHNSAAPIIGVCGGADAIIHVFRILFDAALVSLIALRSVRMPTAGVNTVTLRRDAAVFAVSAWDHTVTLIRTADAEPLTVTAHTAASNETAFALTSAASTEPTAMATAVLPHSRSVQVHSLALTPALGSRTAQQLPRFDVADLFASADGDNCVRVFAFRLYG